MQTTKSQQADERTQQCRLIQIGNIGNWPVYAGFPIRPSLLKRGVQVTICTHWQAVVDVYAATSKALMREIENGIELAVKQLEKCDNTPDPMGLREYALKELRKGHPAIVPHPVSLANSK